LTTSLEEEVLNNDPACPFPYNVKIPDSGAQKPIEMIPVPSFSGFEAIQIIPNLSEKSPVLDKYHVPYFYEEPDRFPQR
jgi:hypothetical protein